MCGIPSFEKIIFLSLGYFLPIDIFLAKVFFFYSIFALQRHIVDQIYDLF